MVIIHIHVVIINFFDNCLQATSGELIDEKKLIGCAQLSVLKD